METQQLIELWKRARNRGENVYLATVVHIVGSSYRKPGTRMLVTSRGERAGTISGGCLEAEVARKIAWFTRNGAFLKSYRSSFDGDDVPYGLGCGGTIWVLMEAGDSVDAMMEALRSSLERRAKAVVLMSLSNDGAPHTRVISEAEIGAYADSSPHEPSIDQMKLVLSENRVVASFENAIQGVPQHICMPVIPPQRLFVFGAGDDAQPIVRSATELGWEAIVADSRSHLLRQERFPLARHLSPLPLGNLASPDLDYELAENLRMNENDCAIILTHSHAQDRYLLKNLLIRPLRYLGILGPRHRTNRILGSICSEIGLSEQECMKRLHAPVGLDIGKDNPAIIALSIVAEVQAQVAGVSIKVEKSGSEISS